MTTSGKPNKLIHSSSPYLKQHAYNPVDWHSWGPEALEKAVKEDKPLIISIGYSACHWCHVMEHESFENKEIARVMNEGFVCIKVDREERPDVDQIYMEAIQTMGLNGGWPLNVFAMPDQKPFYGGTYFQQAQWLHILKSVRQAFLQKREDLEKSATEFARAISRTDSEKYGLADLGFDGKVDDLKQMIGSLKSQFDQKYGGLNRAPKFPNPTIWRFLLSANILVQDSDVNNHIMLTLNKMASGGIYDQVGGGFARYSVDERWFAPHFEKMLYDNGQLVSLYATAYLVEKHERFREVVNESVEFIRRELMNEDGGFYAALDADSEGEEGNYYIWSNQELNQLLGKEADLIKSYYNTEDTGNWERGLNILYTSTNSGEFAKGHDISLDSFKETLAVAKKLLLNERAKRERPGLDDKILTSWNALMLKGLVDAYHAFGESSFLELAQKNAVFIHEKLWNGNALLRTFSYTSEVISAYLDDYAFTIDAYCSLYQASFEQKWLELAVKLVDYTIENFYDPAEELFFYTDKNAESLISRKKEIFDNVIPASNSAMAENLYILGNLMEQQSYMEISKNMISKIAKMIKTESQYLTNWGTLYSYLVYPTVEIAIIGEDYLSFANEIQRHFIPNKVIAAAGRGNDLPLLQHREAIDGKTTIYVCFNKSCKLPVHTVSEALTQINEGISISNL